MAKYLVLIYGDETIWEGWSPEEQEANGSAHAAFAARAGSAVIGGHQLESAGAATTIRADADGRPTATDGPFLETKEVLGGYYLLEAAGMEEAVELASGLREASAPSSGVEIRPVKENS
jgi:hypothetical protein